MYGSDVGNWPPFWFSQPNPNLRDEKLLEAKKKYEDTLNLYRFVTTVEPHAQVWPSSETRFDDNYLQAKWISLPRLLAASWKCSQRDIDAVKNKYNSIGLGPLKNLFNAIEHSN
jgi:hypothetical protein